MEWDKYARKKDNNTKMLSETKKGRKLSITYYRIE